ncbi:hypothetical protein HDU96_008132 [Phlyctochytrium bullatum]|nr:hypothetical protein HDU96_008132 [Phlyctochytrium bullatum]
MVLPRTAAAIAAAIAMASAATAQTTTPELDECGKVFDALSKISGTPTLRSIPFDLVKACYSTFPADAEFKAQHVKELKPFLDAYPFADLYLNPPSPPTFPGAGIDAMKELDRIAADPTITTQYDFYTKIYEMVGKFNDAHFSYRPGCLTAFTFRQPFRLGPTYPTPDGKPVIKVIDVSPASPVWTPALGTANLGSFLNYTVKAIDGLPAADAIQAFADKYLGFARSDGSRFNAALARRTYAGGNFITRPGRFFEFVFLPSDTQPRTYVLTPPPAADGTQPADVTVTVPWAAFPRTVNGITSITNAEFYENLCLNPNLLPRPLQRRDLTLQAADADYEDLIPRTVTPPSALAAAHAVPAISDAVLAEGLRRRKATLARRQTSTVPSPIANSPDTAFYVLDDGITGVWVFPTVSPSAPYENWLGTITGGLRAFEQSGVKRLIIDVTANGGGDFCASTAFAEYLLQNTPMIVDQVRITPAVRSLLKIDFFGLNAGDGDVVPVSGNDIVAEAYTQDRGNGPQLLSGRFKFCQSAGATPAGFVQSFNLPELERGWAPEDIAVVSDGGCGSACACMIRSMRDAHPGFKAYTYGGSTGLPYTPTSFEGGIVVGFATFGRYDPALDLLTPEERAALPGNFTINLAGGLPITQGYSPRGKEALNYPAEWIPQPSDEHLVVANPTDKKSVWDTVAKRMRVPGPPLPRTRLVPLSTTATATTSTATATTATLPTTSEVAATTVSEPLPPFDPTTTITTATPGTSVATTATATPGTSATTEPTTKPQPKPYGAHAGNHAGWNEEASNNPYVGGYGAQAPAYAAPAAGGAAAGVYAGEVVPKTVRPAQGYYAALTSRAAMATSTAKNVVVNGAEKVRGVWGLVGAVVGLRVIENNKDDEHFWNTERKYPVPALIDVVSCRASLSITGKNASRNTPWRRLADLPALPSRRMVDRALEALRADAVALSGYVVRPSPEPKFGHCPLNTKAVTSPLHAEALAPAIAMTSSIPLTSDCYRLALAFPSLALPTTPPNVCCSPLPAGDFEAGLPSDLFTPAVCNSLGRILHLNLAARDITGAIPNLVGFDELRNLSLARNGLTGGIPPELGRLRRLERLSLSGNVCGVGAPNNCFALSDFPAGMERSGLTQRPAEECAAFNVSSTTSSLGLPTTSTSNLTTDAGAPTLDTTNTSSVPLPVPLTATASPIPTTDAPPNLTFGTAPPASPNLALIIGPTVAAVIAILVLVGVAVVAKTRASRRKHRDLPVVDPTPSPPSTSSPRVPEPPVLPLLPAPDNWSAGIYSPSISSPEKPSPLFAAAALSPPSKSASATPSPGNLFHFPDIPWDAAALPTYAPPTSLPRRHALRHATRVPTNATATATGSTLSSLPSVRLPLRTPTTSSALSFSAVGSQAAMPAPVTLSDAVVRWGCAQTCAWVRGLGVGEDVVDRFEAFHVTGEALVRLTDAQLRAMGVRGAERRERVLGAVARLVMGEEEGTGRGREDVGGSEVSVTMVNAGMR